MTVRPDTSAVSDSDGLWHSRGYLPHFDQPGRVQMITFRLVDALPASVLRQLDDELKGRNDLSRQRLEAYLDTGNGACYLRDARIARLVEAALLQFDGVRYHLLSWVLMPNHVHVLIGTVPGYALSKVVHSWKSFAANAANRMLGSNGTFWQREYFDRAIRDEHHLAGAVAYVHENPCRAGLVDRPEQWRFSSASASRR